MDWYLWALIAAGVAVVVAAVIYILTHAAARNAALQVLAVLRRLIAGYLAQHPVTDEELTAWLTTGYQQLPAWLRAALPLSWWISITLPIAHLIEQALQTPPPESATVRDLAPLMGTLQAQVAGLTTADLAAIRDVVEAALHRAAAPASAPPA